MERLGIVDELMERRESVVASLSPVARHQAFPTVYARPVPRGELPSEETGKLLAKIQKMAGEIASLKEENSRLRLTIEGIPYRKEEPSVGPPAIPILDVMQRFCDRMNADGLSLGDEQWSLSLLRSARRSHPVVYPRHVCMWLIRTICSEPSYPKIGFAFGGFDHTSVIHGIKKTPEILKKRPDLLKVATDVLRSYGIVLARLEEGGQS